MCSRHSHRSAATSPRDREERKPRAWRPAMPSAWSAASSSPVPVGARCIDRLLGVPLGRRLPYGVLLSFPPSPITVAVIVPVQSRLVDPEARRADPRRGFPNSSMTRTSRPSAPPDTRRRRPNGGIVAADGDGNPVPRHPDRALRANADVSGAHRTGANSRRLPRTPNPIVSSPPRHRPADRPDRHELVGRSRWGSARSACDGDRPRSADSILILTGSAARWPPPSRAAGLAHHGWLVTPPPAPATPLLVVWVSPQRCTWRSAPSPSPRSRRRASLAPVAPIFRRS